MKPIGDNADILVRAGITVKDALKRMDSASEGILFVVSDSGRLIGSLSDGDLRRALLDGRSLGEGIEGAYNPKPFNLIAGCYDLEEAKKLLLGKRFTVVPVVDGDGVIVGYETWEALLGHEVREPKRGALDVPVVVMAGGKGTRMAPFTNVLPKPLIPIGEKTILEVIVDGFLSFSVKDFYFTINYRGEMIKAYFDGIEKAYSVTYLREADFYGTAGSLALLPEGFDGTFIVTNCDIIVKADYADVLRFHRSRGARMTVLSSIQHHIVPYGVIEFEQGGQVTSITEKPEYSFCINTGVYVLEAECLELIPPGKLFHMTHLMEALMARGDVVVTYPVNESDYIDIGQWEEYRSAVGKLAVIQE